MAVGMRRKHCRGRGIGRDGMVGERRERRSIQRGMGEKEGEERPARRGRE